MLIISLKHRLNKKRYKVNDSCRKLLARRFFDVIETGDLRYILRLKDYDKLPEYDQSLLLDYWDKIMEEYEEDSGNSAYTQHMRKTNYFLMKENRINGLKACYMMMFVNPELAIENLKYWDIQIKSKNELLQRIRAEETKLRIDKIRDKNNSDKQEGKNYFETIIHIIRSSGITINDETVSIKQLNIHIKLLNEYNNKLKKQIGGTT